MIAMKTLLAAIIFTSLIALLYGPENCWCIPASDDDTTRWDGNESVIVKEEKVYRHLSGTVTYQDNTLLSDALVEIYTHPEYLLLKYPESETEKKKQRRIAACVTQDDGKFCFWFIESGKYELRISQGKGMNVTHIYVEVNPSDSGSTDAEIRAVLTPGT